MSITALCLPHIQRLTIYGDGETVVRGEKAIKELLTRYGILLPPNQLHQHRPCHDQLHHTRVQLACLQCGRRLSRTVLQLLPLPNAQWQELVDCWSCHQSEFAIVTTRLAWDGPTGQLLPRPACALLGGFWLTVNAKDMCPSPTVDGCACPDTRADWQVLNQDSIRILASNLVYEQEEGESLDVAGKGMKIALPLVELIKDELNGAWETLCTYKLTIIAEKFDGDQDGCTSTRNGIHLECLAPKAFIYLGKEVEGGYCWKTGALVRWHLARFIDPANGPLSDKDGVYLRWPSAAYDQLLNLLRAPCPIPLSAGQDDQQWAFIA